MNNRERLREINNIDWGTATPDKAKIRVSSAVFLDGEWIIKKVSGQVISSIKFNEHPYSPGIWPWTGDAIECLYKLGVISKKFLDAHLIDVQKLQDKKTAANINFIDKMASKYKFNPFMLEAMIGDKL